MNDNWLAKAAQVLRGVRTPLALGGLTVLVLCVIYNKILGLEVFSTMTANQTAGFLSLMVSYVFWLALVAVVLGVVGYLVRPGAGGSGHRPKKRA